LKPVTMAVSSVKFIPFPGYSMSISSSCTTHKNIHVALSVLSTYRSKPFLCVRFACAEACTNWWPRCVKRAPLPTAGMGPPMFISIRRGACTTERTAMCQSMRRMKS
jgi:hypothetical protein